MRTLNRTALGVTTVLALWSGTAAAQVAFEVKGGVLWHDAPGLWSGFRREREPVDVNVEILPASGLPLLGGAIRPAVGGNVNTGRATSNIYLDARYEIELPAALFFGLGLGATWHDGRLGPTETDRKALGSRVLFHVPVELGVRLDARQSLSVYFEHMSNGYTKDVNEGLDRLGVRYGYRF